MAESGTRQVEDDAWWAALAARVLHPAQVQVIEALGWIDQPLSAADLAEIVETKLRPSQLVHHLRRLDHIDALEVAEDPELGNAVSIRFRLAPKESGDEPMCGSASRLPQERDLRVENVVLLEIVGLHPIRLTSEELVVRMEDGPSDTGRVAIMDALQALKRSGLVRLVDDAVEPTYAALRATAVLQS